MSQDDELLNFIVDGLPGKQRDLVARSFYALGHGNPDSSPVQMTVMFTACTRKIARYRQKSGERVLNQESSLPRRGSSNAK
jgi:hypothetical protein